MTDYIRSDAVATGDTPRNVLDDSLIGVNDHASVGVTFSEPLDDVASGKQHASYHTGAARTSEKTDGSVPYQPKSGCDSFRTVAAGVQYHGIVQDVIEPINALSKDCEGLAVGNTETSIRDNTGECFNNKRRGYV